MKRLKILKHAAIVLILAGVLSSCTKKTESDDKIPYVPCPCEEEKDSREIFQGEAYLFKDSIPIQMVKIINNEFFNKPRKAVCWILYFSENDYIEIIIGNYKDYSMIGRGTICNFPYFAREWNIPQNGCKVDIKGLMYDPCTCYGVTNVFCFDYVLTSLKRI